MEFGFLDEYNVWICVSSLIHVFIQPVFHVFIIRVVAWWLWVFMSMGVL